MTLAMSQRILAESGRPLDPAEPEPAWPQPAHRQWHHDRFRL